MGLLTGTVINRCILDAIRVNKQCKHHRYFKNEYFARLAYVPTYFHFCLLFLFLFFFIYILKVVGLSSLQNIKKKKCVLFIVFTRIYTLCFRYLILYHFESFIFNFILTKLGSDQGAQPQVVESHEEKTTWAMRISKRQPKLAPGSAVLVPGLYVITLPISSEDYLKCNLLIVPLCMFLSYNRNSNAGPDLPISFGFDDFPMNVCRSILGCQTFSPMIFLYFLSSFHVVLNC